jgi:flagellar FliJ protein
MKHDPMQTLVNLAQTRQETALKQLADLLAASRSQEEKLALLKNYRNDYQAKLAADTHRGIAPQDLANFRQFIGQLEIAVLQQGDTVTRSLTQAENGRRRWQASLQALRSFEAILDRRARAARQSETRRDQARDDEFASRLVSSASSGK